MSDQLDLLRLEIATPIGVTAEERSHKQQIFVSLSLSFDALPTAEADDPSQGIDYALLTQELRIAAQKERKTIERLAEDLAAIALKTVATSVSVTVEKHPPLPGLEAVSVTIRRNRLS